MAQNIFEYATRNKLRFPYKGAQSVESLWDLPVTELDSIFKVLNAQSKLQAEESLLATKSAVDEILRIQIEIIKYIVAVKLEEKRAAEQAAEKKREEQKIMSILASRSDKALEEASDEELQQKLAELRQ